MRYILFVQPHDENCLRAQKLSCVESDMLDVNVLKLTHTPLWLRGVPSILDTKTATLYEGTQCLQFLQGFNMEQPMVFPSSSIEPTTTVDDFLQTLHIPPKALSPILEKVEVVSPIETTENEKHTGDHIIEIASSQDEDEDIDEDLD